MTIEYRSGNRCTQGIWHNRRGLGAYQASGEVVERAPKKETDWQSPFTLALKFRHQIRRAYVESDTRGKWQAVLAEYRNLLCHQGADQARPRALSSANARRRRRPQSGWR